MSNKMLIDATHPEETRVVVLRGNKVEEFDFEAAERQQLRGNIYLAKVTRVEPSLQAAFVEYGGNRHGFLAFSEIHPDYYQIPFADRQALIQEQAREEAEEAAEEAAADLAAEQARLESGETDSSDGDIEVDRADDVETIAAHVDPPEEISESADAETRPADDSAVELEDTTGRSADAESDAVEVSESAEPAVVSRDWPSSADTDASDSRAGRDASDAPGSLDAEPAAGPTSDSETRADENRGETPASAQVENVGAGDALEEVRERRKPRPRQYKIQEVIKRRQVILVQVVKEERGNKGAALTTYLSLAGRYSVLMPNTGRGGGISRKITNAMDRKRLKEIAGELDVPEGMGVILRTAGANRTKAEVKRDFEYLLRLWENVRELTLRSSAPKLVYEEGSLIKRSIRDLYSREIEQIMVAGEEAYKEAKDFMRMLMPSHARNVQLYREESPIFAKNGVESQLDAMFSPRVTLRSGGYIVINQTEALVAIDVNSGRSTREHNIEDTALNTNLEAAEEVSRQLRLRDLAGLIVIDFIDMEENRNNRAVERKLKDCLRADRARIQIGRISHFGLMEMSRQRMRTGVLESSMVMCPTCHGTGQVRSISSLSLQMLRAIEDHLLRNSGHHLYVHTRPEVALYVLNQKRAHLTSLESRFDLSITVTGDAPDNGAGFAVERGEPVEHRGERPQSIAPPPLLEEPEDLSPIEDDADAPLDDEGDRFGMASSGAGDVSGNGSRDEQGGDAGRERGKRRRRRRRGGEDRHESREASDGDANLRDGAEGDPDAVDTAAEAAGGGEIRGEDGEAEARRRRRGRRGGRRRGRNRENGEADANGAAGFVDGDERGEAEAGVEHRDAAFSEAPADTQMLGGWAPSGDAGGSELERAAVEQVTGIFGAPPGEAEAGTSIGREEFVEQDNDPAAAQPDAASIPEPVAAAEPVSEDAAVAPQPIEDDRPKRSGWWSKKLFS